MKNTTYYQQGDVRLVRIDKLPEGLQKQNMKKGKSLVLQMSETTGHHHHFAGNAAVDLYQRPTSGNAGVSTITPNEGKFIVVNFDSPLYHGKGFEDRPADTGNGDHNSITIPAGIYEIDIVREWDYDSNEPMRVVD